MMWRLAIKYALACGLFLVLIFGLSYRLGSNPLIDFRHLFIDLILFGLFLFFACREFKIYHNDLLLHFWQGMTISFFTYVPAVLVYGIGLVLFFVLDPDLLMDYKEQARAFLIANKEKFTEGVSADTYEKQLADIENITTTQMVSSAVVKKLIIGFFISPVISIILRKKPN